MVVKNGTVLAVEAFEGTNDAIKRGGALARKGAVMVKVSKPNQDMRFDVPVIGAATIEVAAEANIRVIAVEAGRTLLLEKDELIACAARKNVVDFRLLVAISDHKSTIRDSDGVLAQLVEHRNGIAGVRGSNPLGSSYSSAPVDDFAADHRHHATRLRISGTGIFMMSAESTVRSASLPTSIVPRSFS